MNRVLLKVGMEKREMGNEKWGIEGKPNHNPNSNPKLLELG